MNKYKQHILILFLVMTGTLITQQTTFARNSLKMFESSVAGIDTKLRSDEKKVEKKRKKKKLKKAERKSERRIVRRIHRRNRREVEHHHDHIIHEHNHDVLHHHNTVHDEVYISDPAAELQLFVYMLGAVAHYIPFFPLAWDDKADEEKNKMFHEWQGRAQAQYAFDFKNKFGGPSYKIDFKKSYFGFGAQFTRLTEEGFDLDFMTVKGMFYPLKTKRYTTALSFGYDRIAGQLSQDAFQLGYLLQINFDRHPRLFEIFLNYSFFDQPVFEVGTTINAQLTENIYVPLTGTYKKISSGVAMSNFSIGLGANF